MGGREPTYGHPPTHLSQPRALTDTKRAHGRGQVHHGDGMGGWPTMAAVWLAAGQSLIPPERDIKRERPNHRRRPTLLELCGIAWTPLS
jgi:hypothetical protein